MYTKQYYVYILSNFSRTTLYCHIIPSSLLRGHNIVWQELARSDTSQLCCGVVHCGITNDLKRRVWEHRNDLVKGFSQKYQIHDLVYYEIFNDPENAIEREKQIKNYSRLKKEKMIVKFNPKVVDLYDEIIR